MGSGAGKFAHLDESAQWLVQVANGQWIPYPADAQKALAAGLAAKAPSVIVRAWGKRVTVNLETMTETSSLGEFRSVKLGAAEASEAPQMMARTASIKERPDDERALGKLETALLEYLITRGMRYQELFSLVDTSRNGAVTQGELHTFFVKVWPDTPAHISARIFQNTERRTPSVVTQLEFSRHVEKQFRRVNSLEAATKRTSIRRMPVGSRLQLRTAVAASIAEPDVGLRGRPEPAPLSGNQLGLRVGRRGTMGNVGPQIGILSPVFNSPERKRPGQKLSKLFGGSSTSGGDDDRMSLKLLMNCFGKDDVARLLQSRAQGGTRAITATPTRSSAVEDSTSTPSLLLSPAPSSSPSLPPSTLSRWQELLHARAMVRRRAAAETTLWRTAVAALAEAIAKRATDSGGGADGGIGPRSSSVEAALDAGLADTLASLEAKAAAAHTRWAALTAATENHVREAKAEDEACAAAAAEATADTAALLLLARRKVMPQPPAFRKVVLQAMAAERDRHGSGFRDPAAPASDLNSRSSSPSKSKLWRRPSFGGRSSGTGSNASSPVRGMSPSSPTRRSHQSALATVFRAPSAIENVAERRNSLALLAAEWGEKWLGVESLEARIFTLKLEESQRAARARARAAALDEAAAAAALELEEADRCGCWRVLAHEPGHFGNARGPRGSQEWLQPAVATEAVAAGGAVAASELAYCERSAVGRHGAAAVRAASLEVAEASAAAAEATAVAAATALRKALADEAVAWATTASSAANAAEPASKVSYYSLGDLGGVVDDAFDKAVPSGVGKMVDTMFPAEGDPGFYTFAESALGQVRKKHRNGGNPCESCVVRVCVSVSRMCVSLPPHP